MPRALQSAIRVLMNFFAILFYLFYLSLDEMLLRGSLTFDAGIEEERERNDGVDKRSSAEGRKCEDIAMLFDLLLFNNRNQTVTDN